MPIDFTQPIEQTALGNEEAIFLNTEVSALEGVDFWYNISIFTSADVIPGTDTGWDTIQVNDEGYLRAEVEADTLTAPVIQNISNIDTITIFFYPEGSVHFVGADVEQDEAPAGFFGYATLSMSTLSFNDGSKTLTALTVDNIVSPV